MKVTISLKDELLSRIDCFADDMNMRRSGVISLACTQFLNANEGIRVIREMSDVLQKIADKGELDEESKRQIEDFGRVARLMSGK